MGKKSRRKREQRRRIWGRSETERIVKALTSDVPADVRRAMLEASDILDDVEFWEHFVNQDAHQRTAMLLAWRDAFLGLQAGKRCDLCPADARKVRFILVMPGEDFRGVKVPDPYTAFMGFAILCVACNRLSAEECHAGILDRYARDAAGCEFPYRRPVIVGRKIGEAGELPRRHALENCDACGQTIWIDRDESDSASVHPLQFACVDCASKLIQSGRIEAFPSPLVSWEFPRP